MLCGDFQEATLQSVELENVNPDAFLDAIALCLGGEVPATDAGRLLDLA
eukprot:CAMPEP_0113723608 /NCGR_PEP_ID=MMETSP0038_2-20120614/38535_1 /TAXON_ID=2898 /ORGANISM="Cryptomonas paramecium" /LENGTH=48 /DNA_ID=CAMNT_0000653251 /DNA_START=187 /DNA_END=330 /DNA_ORIENTATION=- /assembly_acc=CAM_ASM_000170